MDIKESPKLRTMLRDLVNEGYLSRQLDESGQVGYSLTSKAESRPDLALSELEQAIVEIQMPTEKVCCNAAAVVATTAGEHTKALQDDIDALKSALDSWRELAADFNCNSIPEMRVFIGACFESASSALKSFEEEKHRADRIGKSAVDFCESLPGVIGGKTPMSLAEALDFIAAAISKPPAANDSRFIVCDAYDVYTNESTARARALQIAADKAAPVLMAVVSEARHVSVNWEAA
jgi:hypothetical protein